MPIKVDDGSTKSNPERKIDASGSIVDPYWWSKSATGSGRTFENIWPLINQIQKEQRIRTETNLRHQKLYSNIDTLGVSYGEFGFSQSYDQVTYNLCKSVVDTVLSTIFTQKTRVSVLTSGGNYSSKKQGEQLEKAISGLFHITDTYREVRKAALDCLVCDTGFIKITRDNSDRQKVNVERIFPDEVIVDDQDSIYGKPRSIHHLQLVSRDVLLNWYDGDKKTQEKIRQCERAQIQAPRRYNTVADQVFVVESWHLPSGKDTKDGRHTITIPNADLCDEEYIGDSFPILALRWSDRPRGYYGRGLVNDLEGVQYEINLCLLKMQDAMRDNVVRIGIEEGSNIVESHINDIPFTTITFHNNPPVPLVFNTFPPEMVNYLQGLITRGYEISGVSQMMANSSKPAGLNSAIAQREFKDTQSQRFMLAGQKLEEFYVDIAMRLIDVAKEIDSDPDGDGFVVRCTSGKYIESIKWSDVDLDRDAFIIRPYPTSFLPLTPAGQLEVISEMMQNQLISREEALMLLNYPDLESVTSLANSAIKHVDMLIENMLDKDMEYRQPDSFDNLDLAIRRMAQAILKAEMDGYPEERIDKLRQYVSDAKDLLDQSQPQAPVDGAQEMMSQQANQATPQALA